MTYQNTSLAAVFSIFSTAGDLNARGILTTAVDTVEKTALFRMTGRYSR